VELIVRRGDREERVRVERDGPRFRVRIGERTYEVEAAVAGGAAGGAGSGAGGSGALHSLRLDGAHFEVAVHPDGDGRWRVSSRRGAVEVEIDDPLTHLARETRGGAAVHRQARVTAMMPGRVVALLAAEGAPVTAGQGVVVLEAMKMENEILADRDGVVQKIFVTAGQPVEGGEPLFEIG
jgi:pyruvate carboxylase subunit B